MKLSILVPVYNEDESLSSLYLKLHKVLKTHKYNYEIIFINDGSTDDTEKEILKLIKKDKNIHLVSFQKNYGKSAALSVGFKKAKGDYLVTMDGDLQDDPEEIPSLIAKLEEGYDLVSGWKFKRYDPITKTLPSKLFNFVLRLFSKVKIHDFNCGLKIYKKPVYKALDVYGSLHRFLPALSAWMGFRVTEIKVHHHKRKFGKSKFGAGRFSKGLFDFLTVIFLNKYIKHPLHLFGGLGFFFGTIGVLMSGYVLYIRIVTGTIQARLPLFLGGVLLILVGIQLFSIGLLAEIFVKNTNSKDDYIVNLEK